MSMIFQDPTSSLNPVFTVGEQITSVIKASLQARNVNLNKNDVKNIALKAVSYTHLDVYKRQAIDRALKETDFNERLKLYRKAQELIVEYQPHIPIFEEPEVHAYQSGYLTWEPAELGKQGKTIVPGLDLLYMLGVQFKE